MLRAAALVVSVLLLGSASANADATWVRVAGGVAVKLGEDGKIDWYAVQATIPLDDGRTLKQVGDRVWQIDPVDVADVKQLSPLDLAVYHRDYAGKRIRTSGELYDATVAGGRMSLPGGVWMTVDLATVPRDLVKQLIQRCGDIPIGKRPSCIVEVTGTVAEQGKLTDFNLVDASLKPAGDAAKGGASPH